MRRLWFALTLPLFLTLSLSTATPAAAQYALVSNRAAIGGPGLIDWATMPSLTPLANPFVVTVTGTPLTATVSSTSVLIRMSQPVGFTGNFTNGDALLYSAASSLDILFSGDIAAAGAQYQQSVGGPFTGNIEAFDVLGNSLAAFNFNGVSNTNADGSAVFAGISSATGGIRRIRFSNVLGSPLYINNLSVNLLASSPPSGSSSVAPEPGSVVLMATGFLVLLAVRRRVR